MSNTGNKYAKFTQREIVMVTPDTGKKIVRFAKRQSMSKNAFIRAALDFYMQHLEAQK